MSKTTDSKMKSMAAAAIEKKAVKEKTKMAKKAKKAVKKTKRRIFRGILWTSFVLCCGIFIGIHRRVIKAYITGGEMPELPANHPKVFCHK